MAIRIYGTNRNVERFLYSKERYRGTRLNSDKEGRKKGIERKIVKLEKDKGGKRRKRGRETEDRVS